MDLGAPVSYLVVEPGADVYSADGERVGTLQHVLADEENDVFDGIVVDTELGPGGLRFADAPDVAECRENGIVLNLTATEVGNLPKPQANPRSWSTTATRVPRARCRQSFAAPGT